VIFSLVPVLPVLLPEKLDQLALSREGSRGPGLAAHPAQTPEPLVPVELCRVLVLLVRVDLPDRPPVQGRVVGLQGRVVGLQEVLGLVERPGLACRDLAESGAPRRRALSPALSAV
jgi:hypothetical protein